MKARESQAWDWKPSNLFQGQSFTSASELRSYTQPLIWKCFLDEGITLHMHKKNPYVYKHLANTRANSQGWDKSYSPTNTRAEIQVCGTHVYVETLMKANIVKFSANHYITFLLAQHTVTTQLNTLREHKDARPTLIIFLCMMQEQKDLLQFYWGWQQNVLHYKIYYKKRIKILCLFYCVCIIVFN